MSVNIYARIKPSEEQLKKYQDRMSAAIMTSRPSAVKSVYEDYAKDFGDIHIGNSAKGWQFCFKVNEDKYACNHRSLDLFLHRVDIIIFDEYGKEMTPEEFWEKHGNSKGDNFKTYYENHPERVAPFRGYDLDDFINVEGMWWCNKEFY
jgi:hypothetical protein